MDPYWMPLIKAAISKIINLRRYWKLVTGFVVRVSTLPEAKEAKQIDNMAKYIDTVAKHLGTLKRSGVPDEQIRRLAVELNVPLIQANLEAMIIARTFSSKSATSNDTTEIEGQMRPVSNTDNTTNNATPPQA